MSTLLRGAQLVDGTVTDVLLDGPVVAAAVAAPPDTVVDLDGYVLLPSFVEPHAHLDKALTVSRSINRTGDLLGAIEAMNAIADTFTTADFARRADAALRIHLAYGTTVVRSHVNIGSTFGMRALAALVEVREAWRGIVDLELVALVGHPLQGSAGTDLKIALSEGADVAGGCPHLDPDPIGAVDACLDIAGEAGVPLDLHTDETLNPRMLTLEHLAEQVSRTGFAHGVTASHCVSLGVQPPDVQQRVAEKVAAAGVAVVALPQTNLYLQGREHPESTPRGLTAVRPLLAAGATVAAGGDNLRDAFHPAGRGDALEVGALMVTAGHLSVPAALHTLTAAGRTALRRAPVALAPGDRADLVAVRAADANEALGAAGPDRLVWSGGRLVARTRLDTQLATTLDVEVTP